MPAKLSNKPPPGVELPRTLSQDRAILSRVKVPIVTISATFRQEIAEHTGERAKIFEEAVFSRAHFSMAIAVFEQAARQKLSSWLVDPTNYVSEKHWAKVAFTEWLGEQAARRPVLKKIKDLVDTFVRNKLPIEKAITPPLSYVTSLAKKPMISLHYEVGNILAQEGKKVLQVVTDPHVRVNYLFEAERPNITFAVFDDKTKKDFLKKAHDMDKSVTDEKVVVTGPPVDPRIVLAREKKNLAQLRKRPLRLVIATGGLGTNKGEIKKIIFGLLEELTKKEVQVILYAGTHYDIAGLINSVCRDCKIVPASIEDLEAPVRVIYSSNIVHANNDLIKYGFPWADGFVTKPSGDMAYDAVASGCFILSLTPWGEWEENIKNIFTNLGICQEADPTNFPSQIKRIISSGWAKEAVKRALAIDKLFLEGAKKIVDLQQELS